MTPYNDKIYCDCLNCYEPLAKCSCGDTEGYENHGAACPYCGLLNLKGNSGGILYREETMEYKCWDCKKTFNVEPYIQLTWSSKRI